MSVRGLPAARPVLLPRSRLDAWMLRSERLPLRVVVAPAGYGKTSALLSWARRADADERLLVWITLDAHLAERTAFWSMLLHHLDAAGTGVHRELVDALARPAESAQQLPALLARQIEDAPALTLVVDSGRHAPEAALIDDLVRLARHHEGFEIVVAARDCPFADDTADISTHFAAADLLFDRAEVAQLADALGIEADADEATRVHAASAGWPSAVRDLLDPDAEASDAAAMRMLELAAHEPWFPLLCDAVVDDRPTRGDLERRGLLPSIAPALERLIRAGLGSWDGDRFVWHPHLRTAVIERYAASAPDALRRAHEAWASMFHERGDAPRAAFRHALDAENWPLAARVYRGVLLQSTGRQDDSPLGSRRLPAIAVQTQPILRFAAALDDFANGRRTRAMQGFAALLATAERRHLSRRHPSIDDAWIQALVMVALRLMGRTDLSRTALHRLERMLADLDDPRGEIEEGRAALLVHSATTLVLSEHLDEAAHLLDDAGIDPLSERPAPERAHVLGMRALVAALRGEMSEAEAALQRREALALPAGYDRTYGAFGDMVAGALVALEHGDASAAERLLDRTREHASTTELWPLLLRAKVLLEWQQGGASAALDLLDDLIAERHRRATGSPFALSTITSLRVRALLALGRLPAARDALADAPQRRSRRWKPLRAQAELLSGDPQRAAVLVASSLGEVSTARERLALLMIAATAAHRTGDRGVAQQHSAAVISMARRRRLRLPLTVVPAHEARTVLADAPDLADALDVLGTFPVSADPAVALTAREEVVLRRLVEDLTMDEVAAALSVSRNTIKSQVRAIYRKLGVDNRADAVDAARRRHLL